MRRATILACAVAVSSVAAGGVAHARRLGIEEAVQLALEDNPRLRSFGARLEQSRDLVASGRGRLLPAIRLSEEFQHYNSPFSIPFSVPTAPGMPPVTISAHARDQDTNTFVVSAEQPLLGLLHLEADYRALRATADATAAQLKAAQSALREGVRTGFLRVFEARALEEIARASQAELTQQVTVAQARLKAGVITNADLLRVQVAAANARQQEIVAHSQGDVERARLLSAVGFAPDDASIELEDPRPLLASADTPLPPAGEAQRMAASARPELEQARLIAEAAGLQRRARWLALLPEVDAEGAYLRVDGQVFAPTNSGYVGIRAQWALWEWGASFYTARAAARQAEAARLDLEQEQRDVATEVTSGLSQANAAASAVDLARQTIASAEEAYRVTGALVQAGSATTTDLLDAQSALTGARLSLARAQYELAIARVSLARVLGQ